MLRALEVNGKANGKAGGAGPAEPVSRGRGAGRAQRGPPGPRPRRPGVLLNVNDGSSTKLIPGNGSEREKEESHLTFEVLVQEIMGCYKTHTERSLHCSCLCRIPEIPFKRQIICLRATPQEDAECGTGLGGNKVEFGEKAPWPLNPDIRKKELQTIHKNCCFGDGLINQICHVWGKITRI